MDCVLHAQANSMTVTWVCLIMSSHRRVWSNDTSNITISKCSLKISTVEVISLSWGVARPLSQRSVMCCCKVINMVGCVKEGESHVIENTGTACRLGKVHIKQGRILCGRCDLWHGIGARITCVWWHVWWRHQMTVVALNIAMPACDVQLCTIRDYGCGPSFLTLCLRDLLACEMV